MARYITPTVLRNGGTGFPLAGVTDLELMGLIAQAEGMIDAYAGVGGDDVLMSGFAPGGPRTEKYPWDGSVRRVYVRSRPVPVQTVTAFAIQTSQSSADGSPVEYVVNPNAVLINNDQGYLEVSSFALISSTGAYVPLPSALIAPWAIVTYTCGYRVPELGLPLGDSGDHTTYHSLIPFWLTTVQAPVIYKNGVVVASSGYTVKASDGSVTFTGANAATDVITADFTHSVPTVITEAAKLASIERAEVFFSHKVGLSGMDTWIAGGGVSYQRAGTMPGRRISAPGAKALARGGGTPEMDWRDMVETFMGLRVGTSSVAE